MRIAIIAAMEPTLDEARNALFSGHAISPTAAGSGASPITLRHQHSAAGIGAGRAQLEDARSRWSKAIGQSSGWRCRDWIVTWADRDTMSSLESGNRQQERDAPESAAHIDKLPQQSA
jgi:hypothetical protein